MKVLRSVLVALVVLSLVACGDDSDAHDGNVIVDSGVENDAATKPPPGDGDPGDGDPGDGDPGDGNPGDGNPGDGDPGDGDPGDGNPGDGDPGDGDPGDGDPGEPIDPNAPATLKFRVLDENAEPYIGAAVRLLGHDIDPETSDDNGEVEFEVPRSGTYQAFIEGQNGAWSHSYPLTVANGETSPSSLTMPSDELIALIEGLTEVVISDDDGLVFFVFETSEVGGQSVEISEGVAFILITNAADPDSVAFVPGSTLTPDAVTVAPSVIYLNVPPAPLSPVVTTSIPDESCDLAFSPPGGWESFARTLLVIPVTCVRDGA